jgi:hypothetical protein
MSMAVAVEFLYMHICNGRLISFSFFSFFFFSNEVTDVGIFAKTWYMKSDNGPFRIK